MEKFQGLALLIAHTACSCYKEHGGNCFGLHVTGRNWRPGYRFPNSWRWADNRRTRERLSGRSTIEIDVAAHLSVANGRYTIATDTWQTAQSVLSALTLLSKYWGGYISLLVGGAGEYGEDEGERLITDARVVRTWPRPADLWHLDLLKIPRQKWPGVVE